MRRLFSTFATGGPGAGLLFMRLIAGISLVGQGLAKLRSGPMIADVLAIAVAVLLFAGLWTPIAGSLVAVLAVWKGISQFGDPWANVLLGAMGIALALLGPGVWSMDARLFGWKRIDVSNRRN